MVVRAAATENRSAGCSLVPITERSSGLAPGDVADDFLGQRLQTAQDRTARGGSSPNCWR